MFVKGKSGNPAGRKAGTTVSAKGLADFIKKKTKGCRELVEEMYKIALHAPELADRIRALSWLADRAVGKVAETQNLNHTGIPAQSPAAPDVPWKRAQ